MYKYLTMYLSTYLPIYLSVYLFIYPSIHPSIYLPTYLPIYMCIYIYIISPWDPKTPKNRPLFKNGWVKPCLTRKLQVDRFIPCIGKVPGRTK